MKQFLFFLLAAIVGLLMSGTAEAQTALKSQYGNEVDTVVNTGTKYLTSSRISGFAEVALVTVQLDEISGTTGGTISLEASVDGVRWYPYFVGRDSSYTFTPADQATNDFRFRLERVRDSYFRVKYVGTGTMQDKIRAYIVK